MDQDEEQSNAAEMSSEPEIVINEETGEKEYNDSEMQHYEETGDNAKSIDKAGEELDNDLIGFYNCTGSQATLKDGCEKSHPVTLKSDLITLSQVESGCSFYQHRVAKNQFDSDEESEDSVSACSYILNDETVISKSEDSSNNERLRREHLSSLPGFYDCDDKISSLLYRRLQLDDNEEGNEVDRIVIDEAVLSTVYESSVEDEIDGLKPATPAPFGDCSSQKGKETSSEMQNSNSVHDEPVVSHSPERKQIFYKYQMPGCSFYPPSDHCTPERQQTSRQRRYSSDCIEKLFDVLDDHSEDSELLTEREQTRMSVEHSLVSRRLDFTSHISETPQKSYTSPNLGTYSMISSPISSRYIKFENTKSPQIPLENSDIPNTTDMRMPVLNVSPTSSNRHLKRNLSSSAEVLNSERTVSDLSELPSSSNKNAPDTKDYQQSNVCSSSRSDSRSSTEVSNTPTNKVQRENFSRSCELPNSSNPVFSPKKYQHSKKCTSASNNMRDKHASSLCNLPTASEVFQQPTSLQFPQAQYPKQPCKSARKLNFDDSDSSNDGAKEKTRVKKDVRKKRLKPSFYFSDSSDNQSILPKTDNEENIPDNELSSIPSSEEDKTCKPEMVSESQNCLEVMNFENVTEPIPPRKRQLSKTTVPSDIENSDDGADKIKKPKIEYFSD